MAVLSIPIWYGAWKIMSGHHDHPVKGGDEGEALHTAGGGMPQFDVPYIHEASGDQWGFAKAETNNGTEGMEIAWFRSNGMQGRDMYELRPTGDGTYALYTQGSDADCGITIFVYPGSDSIRVTRDERVTVFKTADSFDHAVSSIDPDYTPARYAIKLGDYGGKFETLQSGEETYTFPSGEYARSQWVKDGDRFYYVDASGCKMKDNYAHDGFYAGSDGAWDKSVTVIDRNVLPENGAAYTDDGTKTWTFQLTTDDSGTISGTAHLSYGKSLDFKADYNVRSFGSSAYALSNVKDEFEAWHAVVLDGGRTLRVSGAGVTEVYHKK